MRNLILCAALSLSASLSVAASELCDLESVFNFSSPVAYSASEKYGSDKKESEWNYHDLSLRRLLVAKFTDSSDVVISGFFESQTRPNEIKNYKPSDVMLILDGDDDLVFENRDAFRYPEDSGNYTSNRMFVYDLRANNGFFEDVDEPEIFTEKKVCYLYRATIQQKLHMVPFTVPQRVLSHIYAIGGKVNFEMLREPSGGFL